MPEYKKILLVVDLSDDSQVVGERAKAIAACYKSSITLLHVVEYVPVEPMGEALLRRGHAPFVPHLNHHWHARHPHTHAQWLALDLPWLEAADAVLRLPGPSVGAAIECRRARELGIPVYSSIDAVPPVGTRASTA